MESPMDTLPDELLVHIFGMVPCDQRVLYVPRVCRRWRAMASDWTAAGDARPCLLLLASDSASRAEACLMAARRGHAACVKHFCARNRPTDRASYEAAIQCNDIASLRALGLHEQGLSIGDMAGLAARHASIACLDYAIAHHNRIYIDALTVPWRCDLAAPADHFTCLTRVLDAGCFIGSAGAIEAASGGHADCLATLLPTTGSDTQEIVEACGDHFDCLRVVCQHTVDGLTCDAEALRGGYARVRRRVARQYVCRSGQRRSSRLSALCPRKRMLVG
ncbi:ankyrin repeat protein [Pandoravirus inopinatum]|uniref:Ankyrin repeat protein n=1 Tax=Pandoravirus inopinatum TaxID=1605721 RepID=A0A0B5J7G7_9VIRU|nr:ankyrin repeat protein [Pandoravirus inopinatum]AJF97825.1 ankyrin repeat protein [Pandoravirus inopinatum]